MAFSENIDETPTKAEPQFKNSIMTLSSDMAVFASEDPTKAIEIFQDILAEIRRVKILSI